MIIEMDHWPKDKRSMTIKWRFRELQARQNISNLQISKTLRISTTTVSSWRQSDDLPRLSGERLDQICRILKCSIHDLIYED